VIADTLKELLQGSNKIIIEQGSKGYGIKLIIDGKSKGIGLIEKDFNDEGLSKALSLIKEIIKW
jgi:hypothetical protein